MKTNILYSSYASSDSVTRSLSYEGLTAIPVDLPNSVANLKLDNNSLSSLKGIESLVI